MSQGFVDEETVTKVSSLPRHERLSPSGLPGCSRGIFYDRLGFKRVPDAKLLRIFKDGHRIHKMIQEELVAEGRLRYVEGPMVSEDPPLFGKTDGVTTYPEEPEGILEVKSTSKHPDDILVPRRDHVLQGNLYAGLLDLPQSRVLYHSKLSEKKLGGTPRRKEFVVPFDPLMFEEMLDKAYNILWALDHKQAPMKECWRCENPYCFDYPLMKREGIRDC